MDDKKATFCFAELLARCAQTQAFEPLEELDEIQEQRGIFIARRRLIIPKGSKAVRTILLPILLLAFGLNVANAAFMPLDLHAQPTIELPSNEPAILFDDEIRTELAPSPYFLCQLELPTGLPIHLERFDLPTPKEIERARLRWLTLIQTGETQPQPFSYGLAVCGLALICAGQGMKLRGRP